MMPPTIADYYRNATERARAEIESTSDDRVLGMDREAWIEYLTRKWGMSEIVFDDSRPVELSEGEREYRTRTYDPFTDREPGTLVREPAVRIEVPVKPSDTLEAIWHHKLAPNTFSISHPYPPFEYDHGHGLLTDLVQPEQPHVTRGIERIKATVHAYNESIKGENPRFRQEIMQAVDAKRDQVLKKHRNLDDLAAAVGIPLKKRADISTVVPTALKVRTNIAPVLPPPSKPPTRPVLDPEWSTNSKTKRREVTWLSDA